MENVKLLSFVLFVKDVTISKEFYEKILDQEVLLNINDINVGFKSGLAIWQRKYALNTIYDKDIDTKEVPKNLEIYFETSVLDEMFEKIQKNRVKIVHPIKIQPWQQRVFRIYDPDNNIVEIAEAMGEVVMRLKNEGMSVEAIAEKIFMPKEVVQTFLK